MAACTIIALWVTPDGSRPVPDRPSAASPPKRHRGAAASRIADPHFADDEIVAAVAEGRGAGIHRMKDLVEIIRCCREINGWPVQIQCSDTQFQPAVSQSWLMAAPPLKFHTICWVTSCRNGLRPASPRRDCRRSQAIAVLDLRPVGLPILPSRRQAPVARGWRLCRRMPPPPANGIIGLVGVDEFNDMTRKKDFMGAW